MSGAPGHYDAAGEDLALQRRVGALEHDTITLKRDLAKLDREVANTKDLVVGMLGPVQVSLGLLQKQGVASQKQLGSMRKQVRKLFGILSRERRKQR